MAVKSECPTYLTPSPCRTAERRGLGATAAAGEAGSACSHRNGNPSLAEPARSGTRRRPHGLVRRQYTRRPDNPPGLVLEKRSMVTLRVPDLTRGDA